MISLFFFLAGEHSKLLELFLSEAVENDAYPLKSFDYFISMGISTYEIIDDSVLNLWLFMLTDFLSSRIDSESV